MADVAGVIGTTPIYDADGRVQATTWVNYADAKDLAESQGLNLVVLVDVDDATRDRIAKGHDSATTVVCTPTPSEASKFGGAGVYRYALKGGRLVGGKEPTAQASASLVMPFVRRGGCANGRCGL